MARLDRPDFLARTDLPVRQAHLAMTTSNRSMLHRALRPTSPANAVQRDHPDNRDRTDLLVQLVRLALQAPQAD
jgi:hypothetical protein